MKKLIATTILATAIAIPSFAAEVGTAISATASAGVDKAAQGYQATKGAVEETLAKSNANSAKAEIKSGDASNAAVDASDAAKHKASAMEAEGKAKMHKTAAHKKMVKAKAAIHADADVSATTK